LKVVRVWHGSMALSSVVLKVQHNDEIYRLRIVSAEYDMVWEALNRAPVDLATCVVLVELAESDKRSLTEETWRSAVSAAPPHASRLVVKLHIRENSASGDSSSARSEDAVVVDDRDRRAVLELFATELGISSPETMPLWELEAATDLTQETQREELQRIESRSCDNTRSVLSESSDPTHRATLEAIAGELGIDSPQHMSIMDLEAATQAAQQEEFQRLQMHGQALQAQGQASVVQTETRVETSSLRNCHRRPSRREAAMTGCENQLSRNVATMCNSIVSNASTCRRQSSGPHHSSTPPNMAELPTLDGFVHCGPLQRCGERVRLVHAAITGPVCLFDCEMELVDSIVTGPVTLRGQTQLTLIGGRIVGPLQICRPARFVNQHSVVLGPISQY